MYRFMEVVSERSNYRTLYRFITTIDTDGNITLLGADTEEELAETVEDLLSNGYSKASLVAVQVIDTEQLCITKKSAVAPPVNTVKELLPIFVFPGSTQCR